MKQFRGYGDIDYGDFMLDLYPWELFVKGEIQKVNQTATANSTTEMTQTDNMNAVTSITKSLLKELTVVVQASIKDKLFNNIGLTKSNSGENESYRKNAEYKLRISEFLLQVTMHRLSQQIFASLNWLHEL